MFNFVDVIIKNNQKCYHIDFETVQQHILFDSFNPKNRFLSSQVQLNRYIFANFSKNLLILKSINKVYLKRVLKFYIFFFRLLHLCL